MKEYVLPALKITLVTLIFFSGIYTLIVYGIGRIIAPNGGNGETITYTTAKGTKSEGFVLIGQKFTDDKYFWSRPSAVGYNAMGSGGSNKGPSNPDLLTNTKGYLDTFLKHNPTIKASDVPVEMVTASGSGLDPHLSPTAAKIQLARVAAVRHMTPQQVNALVDQYTEKPWLGMFGTYTINVLKLNVALDQLNSKK